MKPVFVVTLEEVLGIACFIFVIVPFLAYLYWPRKKNRK